MINCLYIDKESKCNNPYNKRFNLFRKTCIIKSEDNKCKFQSRTKRHLPHHVDIK